MSIRPLMATGQFQPTLPSASGSDSRPLADSDAVVVSTHAPLGLGERPLAPRPHLRSHRCFNPRSPRPRGATVQVSWLELLLDVSTHAPLGLGERRAALRRRRWALIIVSTHAPLGLGERPSPSVSRPSSSSGFNPRSPRPRGATSMSIRPLMEIGQFQPTLPSASGSDLPRRTRVTRRWRFNPRSPRPRGATSWAPRCRASNRFNPRSPRPRGATGESDSAA